MLKNSLFQPSLSFCFNASFFFLLFWSTPLFCFSLLFLFSFSTLLSALVSVTFLYPSLFSFLLVALYFSAQNTFFQPKCFSVFQPKRFSVFQPKRFCFSSATLLFFFFLLYSFFVQPSFFSFSASFFSFL